MFDPKSMTTQDLIDAVRPALERAQKHPIYPDADLSECGHVPGVENCEFGGNEDYKQVADYRCSTCPVCLKIVSDALQIELKGRLPSS